MAEKIIIEVNIDDKNSKITLGQLQQNLKKLKEEIKGVDISSDSFKQLSTQIADTNASIKAINKSFTTMQSEVELNDNSILGLEARVKALKQAISGVAIDSTEWKGLQKDLLATDTRLKNVKKSVEGINTEELAGNLGKVAAGIAGTFTAVNAVFGQGDKQIEEFTKDIVAGISVVQSLKAAGEGAAAAQRLWNLAMAANPILAIATAVGALVGVMTTLVISMDDAEEKQLALNEAQKAADKIASDYKLTISELDVQLAKLTGTYEDVKKAQEKALSDKQAKEWSETISTAYDNVKNKSIEFQNALKDENDLKEKQIQAINSVEYKQKRYYDGVGDQQKTARLRELNYAKEKLVEIDNEIKANKTKQAEILKNDKEYQATINGLTEKQEKEKKLLAAQQVADEKAKNEKLIEEHRKYLEKIAQYEKEIVKLIKDTGLEREKILTQAGIKEFEFIDDSYKAYEKLNTNLIEDYTSLANLKNDIELKSLEESNENVIKAEKEKLKEYKKGSDEYKKQEIRIDELILEQKQLYSAKATLLYQTTADERVKMIIKLSSDVRKLEQELNLASLKGEEEIAKAKLAIQFDANKERINNELNTFDKFVSINNKFYNFNEKAQNIIQKDLKKGAEVSKENIQLITEQLGYTEEEVNKIILLLKQLNAEEVKNAEESYKLTEEFLQKRSDLQAKYDADDLSREIKHQDALINQAGDNFIKVSQLNKKKNDLVAQQDINTAYETQDKLFKGLEDNLEKGLMTEEQVAAEKIRIAEDTETAISDIKATNRKANADADKAAMEQLSNTTLDVFDKLQTAQLNKVKNRIGEEYNAQVEAFQAQEEQLATALDNQAITQEEYNAQLKKIEIEREKAELAQRQKTAKAEQDAALFKIAIDTAVAIAKNAGNIPVQLIAAATGLAQAAVVKSTPIPTYADGTVLKGKKHSQGGIPLFQNGTQIAEVEGQETILTDGVQQSPALAQIASGINMLGGGIRLSPMVNKPQTSNVSATVSNATIEAIVQQTVKGISSIPVTNVARDTTKVSRKVENVERRARF